MIPDCPVVLHREPVQLRTKRKSPFPRGPGPASPTFSFCLPDLQPEGSSPHGARPIPAIWSWTAPSYGDPSLRTPKWTLGSPSGGRSSCHFILCHLYSTGNRTSGLWYLCSSGETEREKLPSHTRLSLFSKPRVHGAVGQTSICGSSG